MPYRIVTEREVDGRWIAEIEALPGVMAYGASEDDAVARVQELAAAVVAERLAHGDALPAPQQDRFEEIGRAFVADHPDLLRALAGRPKS